MQQLVFRPSRPDPKQSQEAAAPNGEVMSSRWRCYRSPLSLSLGSYSHADGMSDIDKAIASSLSVIEREVGLTAVLVRSLQAELDHQKAACAEDLSRLAAADVKLKEQAKEAQELRAKNSRLQDEVAAVRMDLRNEKAESEQLRVKQYSRLEEQQLEIADLKKSVTTAKGEVALTKIANVKLRDKVQHLGVDKFAAAKQLKSAQKELAQLEASRRELRHAALEILKVVDPAQVGAGALCDADNSEEADRGPPSPQLVLHNVDPEEAGAEAVEEAKRPAAQVVVKEETGVVEQSLPATPIESVPPAEPRKKRARLQTRGSGSLEQRRSSEVQPLKLRRLSTRGSSTHSTAHAVDEDSVRDLYDTEPWEDVYDKRVTVSRTFEYSTLGKRAKAWVSDVLSFQYKHRQVLWEREHWLPMPCNSPDPGLASAGRKRNQRQSVARKAWQGLETRATNLIRAGILSEDVRSDPWLWPWPKSPVLWSPASRNLVKELQAEDARAAHRNFFVDDKLHHPFYSNKLRRKYPTKSPLPQVA